MRSTAEDHGEGPSMATEAPSTSTHDVSNPQSTTHVGAPLNPSAPTELAPQQTKDIEAQAADLET